MVFTLFLLGKYPGIYLFGAYPGIYTFLRKYLGIYFDPFSI